MEAVTGYVSASFPCNPTEHGNKPFVKGGFYDKDYRQERSFENKKLGKKATKNEKSFYR